MIPSDVLFKWDRAHVACTWTDIDEDGTKFTDDIVWMLFYEQGGWRINGIVVPRLGRRRGLHGVILD